MEEQNNALFQTTLFVTPQMLFIKPNTIFFYKPPKTLSICIFPSTIWHLWFKYLLNVWEKPWYESVGWPRRANLDLKINQNLNCKIKQNPNFKESKFRFMVALEGQSQIKKKQNSETKFRIKLNRSFEIK